ncbi:MAG TPA: TadE/TadG family type IV pilus assembly protein [Candidatus Dormibacteraeota bacterium]|nr:TadE/TadG family type IV pilus assembly protein [Candidatus Dormibacteraeota bacterium]
MTRNGGQSLLELALCAPIVILLALGTAATVQIAGASTGLDAATQAAAGAAARAPDATSAAGAAQARFASVVSDYPLRGAALRLSIGDFNRAGLVIASSSAFVDVGWAALLPFPSHVPLQSQVVLRLEPWRTHRAVS